VGSQALQNNTTGKRNSAFGVTALQCNTTGIYNVGVGDNALRNNTIGTRNIAIGTFTMYKNTVGSCNTAVGYQTLYSNTSGCRNTAVGLNSASSNTIGLENVSMGFQSLKFNTSGCYNVALGVDSLLCNTTANLNTGIGQAALKFTTSGGNNVALGFAALLANTTGTNNTAVGTGAQCTLSTGINNTIAVGCGAVTSATTNHAVWGNSSNTCNCVYAAWSTVSDCRDKINIKTLPSKMGLDLIKKLRPVAFNWDHRDTYVRECKYTYGEKDGNLAGTKEHYGVIAQDLKAVLDELQVRFDGLGHDDEKDAYRVTYEELIAPMIKAIQEQQEQIEVLESRIKTLENK
jgi:hypothetical protein